MKCVRLLLLLLAFNVTQSAYGSTGPQREVIASKAFETLAAKEASRCLQEGQDSRAICSRPAIQRAMVTEEKRVKELEAQIDPKARILKNLREQESAAERSAGRASVGGPVVILHNRNELPEARPAAPVHSAPRPISSGQHAAIASQSWHRIADRITQRSKL